MVRYHHQLNGHEFDHSGTYWRAENPGTLHLYCRAGYDLAIEQ